MEMLQFFSTLMELFIIFNLIILFHISSSLFRECQHLLSGVKIYVNFAFEMKIVKFINYLIVIEWKNYFREDFGGRAAHFWSNPPAVMGGRADMAGGREI